MWWLIIVGSFVALFAFCAFYAEFRSGKGGKYDRTADGSTNYMLLIQQQNSNRNQNSGGL